jgi:hypothetical protein
MLEATRYVGTVFLCVAFVLTGCGGNPTAPSVAQVGGAWTGTGTIISVTSDDCVLETFRNFVGEPGDFSFVITQNGTELTSNSLSGCPLTGTADASSFTLRGTAPTCAPARSRDWPCQPAGSGVFRDLQMTERTITGTLSGTRNRMTMIDKSNVLLPGTETIVGVLTTTINADTTRGRGAP